jgi:hypothetical protein
MRVLITWVDSGWGSSGAVGGEGALERLLAEGTKRWDALYVLAPRALRSRATAALAEASERADAANLWPVEVTAPAEVDVVAAACESVLRLLPDDARVEVVAAAGPLAAPEAWRVLARRHVGRVKLLGDKPAVVAQATQAPAGPAPVAPVAAARPVEAKTPVSTKPPAPRPTDTKRPASAKDPGPSKTRPANPEVGAAFVPLGVRVAAAERAALAEALERTGGNLSQAAALLEVDRNTLKRKMAEHGFPR